MSQDYDRELGVIAVGATLATAALAGCLGPFLLAAGLGLATKKFANEQLDALDDTLYEDAGAQLDAEWGALSSDEQKGPAGKHCQAKVKKLNGLRETDRRHNTIIGTAGGLGVFADPVVGGIGMLVAGMGVRKEKAAYYRDRDACRNRRNAQRAQRAQLDAELVL